MILWLYLHFPRLQLDTLCPEENTPACIVDKHLITQANQTAIETGIEPGMGLGSAASLCSRLQVYPYNPDTEKQKLYEIAHWLYMVTSDIALFPPAGLLLKVTNMLTLYDGLAAYWHSLKTHLDQLGVHYHFATAHSPLAARLMAQSAHNQISDDAKAITNRLSRYPLTATEIDAGTIEKLNRVGIRQLKELLSLDMTDIARRFNIELVNYTGRLTGRFRHPVDFYNPPETFTRYLELMFEMDNLQWLEKPLGKLLNQLETFLRLRDMVAYELTLSLHQREKEDQNVILTSARGDYLAEKWAQLSKLTLESVKLDAPLIAITLTASQMGQLQAATTDIFDGETGALSPPELISLLQAKMGKEAVKGIALTDDPRPEKSSRLCSPFAKEEAAPEKRHIPLRPSILFPAPRPLRQAISILRGPERIATGWWDSEEIVRDYFVAKTEQGRWLWVFRNQQKEWFIHGLFS